MLKTMETQVGVRETANIYKIEAWIGDKGEPKVRWTRMQLAEHTKEGTPIDFLESGISCPEVHEYFASYVNEQGYNDE